LVAKVSPAYTNLRDYPEHQEYRDAVNAAWLEYQSYCPDSEFIKKSQIHFQAMMWQMFLTVFLIRNNGKLLPTKDEGPDIILKAADGGPIYIEAVVAEKGTGKDAPVHFEDLPKTDLGDGVLMGPVVTEEFPNKKIIFRIANAIHNKRTQYAKWVADGVVDPNRPFVIAVCAGPLEGADAPYASYGARTVYGIGPTVLHIPLNREKRNHGIQTSIKFQPQYVKESGSSVSADLFLDGKAAEISGIIFTEAHLGGFMNGNGKDFEFIHNCTANTKLDKRAIPIGYDVWVEQSDSEFFLKSNKNYSES
jgi:hypothetical protein